MGRVLLFNCLMNGTFAVVFVMLNHWALQNQLEETFIFFAVAYGFVIIVSNALFLTVVKAKK